MRVTGIEDFLTQLMLSVDGGFLAGLVDRRQRTVVSVVGREFVSPELEAAFLKATLEALERPRREDLLGAQGELNSTEVQIQDERMRYFARALSDGIRVLVLATERTANAGVSWSLLRATATRVEVELP